VGTLKSPLTHTDIPTEFVPNTPYVKDPAGLWFNPQSVDVKWDTPSEKYSGAEKAACESLADSLIANWMRKRGKVMDMFPRYTALLDSFNQRGCTAVENSQVKRNGGEKFDLITYVHTFQHFLPKEIDLKKIKDSLNPGGYVFIRMPDFKVQGHERDLTPEHYKVANCFWSLDGFLEFLYHNPHFTIADTYEIHPGQRDYILKPIKKKPSVCAGIIAKNEERDLAKCITSLAGVVNSVYLVDTGSTDRTIDVAKEACEEISVPFRCEVFLEASEKDEKGDWKLWNFSQARNRFVEKIEALGFDYLLWMDSDDVLVNKKLKNLVFLDQYAIHGVSIESGGLVWPHHRLWKTKNGIKYYGRCHEYPGFGSLNATYHDEAVYVRHDTTPSPNMENSNPRNLRILQREFAEEPTPRCAFYLGNTYKDCGRWADAVPVYEKRMAYGRGFEDEYWFAVLYKGRCEKNARLFAQSRSTLLKAVQEKSDWAEFWMELCYLEYDQKNYQKALGYSLQAMDLPIVPTTLFREREKYTDQPYRMASWCFEHLGFPEMALRFAEKAKERIGGPDKDWDERIGRLGGKKAWWKPKAQFTWHRPGAIGDVLMTLNLVKNFREKYPDCELTYRCAKSTADILEPLILKAGFNRVETGNKVDGTEFNLVGYPLAEGYPYKPMKKHLVKYFANELGVEYDVENLTFPLPEHFYPRNHGKYLTIHPQAGWSQYKNWPLERWNELCQKLHSEGIATIQIGGPNDVRIKALDHVLGALKPFDASLAALANATIHLGVDSWTNHATNIKWDGKGRTPGVILWGSTQWEAAGYSHNTNISKSLPCQPCFKEDPKISRTPLGPCENPPNQTYENPRHSCMNQITVDEVFDAAIELWEKNARN
jgi:ADP-heptose:LPS heptosyltransferase/glycosyltransferase involved in cell wall biosynthesis